MFCNFWFCCVSVRCKIQFAMYATGVLSAVDGCIITALIPSNFKTETRQARMQ
jgi:hypothetical protein